MVAQFYLQASGLQVCVKRVTAVADIQDYVIAAKRFQSNRHRARIYSRNVFRNAIFYFSYNSIRDCQSVTSISPVVFVVFRITRKCFAVSFEPCPVDGEALRNLSAATHRNQCPSVS